MIRAALGIQGQFSPSLNLDFRSGVMPAGLTFTRNSVATRFNASGVLETVTANTPRFDYDPNTLAIKGLLIEEARTNLVKGSELTNAVAGVIGSGGVMPAGWSLNNAGWATCTVVSIRTDSNGRKLIKIRVQGTNNGSTTVFPRLGFGSYSATVGQTFSSSLYVTSNVSNLSITNFLEEVNASPYTSTFGQLNPGQLTQTRTVSNSSATALNFQLGTNVNAGASLDWTIELGCPQMEVGAFATSYIPTTTAAVTRAVDMCSLPIGSWYNQSEGTWQLEALKPLPQGVPSRYLNLYGSGGSQQFYITNDPTAASMGVALIDSANSTLFSAGISGIPTGSVVKMAVGMRSADYRTCVNGSVINTTSAGLLPTFNMICLGNIPAGIRALNGHLRQTAYYPRRLPNSFLQSLTT